MERAVAMTGLGGQGIQLVAKLLAEAAMREGRQVMMFGIFMGMIRGGASDSTVVLADDEIVSPPIVPACWAVLAMHGDGLAKLAAKVPPGGVLVRNRATVPRAPGWDGVGDVAVPAGELAAAVGQPLGAGMVVLGALAAATGLVAVDSLGEALVGVLPPHRRRHVDANRACIESGARWVAEQGTAGAVPAWT